MATAAGTPNSTEVTEVNTEGNGLSWVTDVTGQDKVPDRTCLFSCLLTPL